MNKNSLLIFLLLTVSMYTEAQFKQDKFITPKLSFGADWIAQSNFENDSGTYKITTTTLNYSMPLWTKTNKGGEAGTFGFYALMINAGANYGWPVLSDLLVQHKLIDGKIGLSAIIYPGNKSMVLLGGNALLNEDNLTIKNISKLRYNGFLIWHLSFNKSFGLNAGAAYTYKFGRGLLTPIIGADFHYKDFKAKLILPLQAEVGFDVVKNLELNILLKPDGSIHNFYNDRFTTEQLNSTILFRQYRSKLGIHAIWRAASYLKINAEAGVAGNQWIAFSSNNDDSKENFTQTNLKTTGYISLTFTLLFGDQPQWGKGHAINYLMDRGVDEVIKLTE